MARKHNSPRAYDAISPAEWRQMLDLHMQGMSYQNIAKLLNRNVKSVDAVVNKTLRNCDDERESPTSKLERAVSSLDPKRTSTGREIEFIKELIGYERTVQEISEICNIPVSRLLKLRDGFFLLFS